MSKGIIFFSNFTQAIPLFVVAVHSLRKFYSGPIHIVLGSSTPEFFIKELQNQKDITFSFVKDSYYQERCLVKLRCWREKPFIIRNESPFDTTLYYDCDHVFYNNFDMSIFDSIKEHGLITSCEKRVPSRMDIIKEEIKKLMNIEIDELEAVNGGCIGYQKGFEGADKWIEYYKVFMKGHRKITGFNCEEFGLAMAIHNGYGQKVDRKWSYGYPRKGHIKSVGSNIAIHYVSSRYDKNKFWIPAFKKACEDNYLNIRDSEIHYVECNEFLINMKNEGLICEKNNNDSNTVS